MSLSHEKRIANIVGVDSFLMIPFGSRVYGNADYSSDYDYYVIDDTLVDNQEIRNGDINFHTYGWGKFKSLVDSHHVGALECYFVLAEKDQAKLKFKLDGKLLRSSFSATSSNSWVKANNELNWFIVKIIACSRTTLDHILYRCGIVVFFRTILLK